MSDRGVMAGVSTRYWHGGAPGRQRGSFLLPPSITGARSLSEFGAASVHRTDRVYLTTEYAAALLYAAAIPKGVVYLCEPIGEPEPDPDCTAPGLSWQCEKARVIKCIKLKPWERRMGLEVLLKDIPEPVAVCRMKEDSWG